MLYLYIGLYLSDVFFLFLVSPCSETIFGYCNLEVQVGSPPYMPKVQPSHTTPHAFYKDSILFARKYLVMF